jgi:hypothetical protein
MKWQDDFNSDGEGVGALVGTAVCILVFLAVVLVYRHHNSHDVKKLSGLGPERMLTQRQAAEGFRAPGDMTRGTQALTL